MALAYTTVQAIKAAGKDLTRGSLIAAVQKGGLTGPGTVPFRFSKTDHSGYGGTQVVTIHNGVPATAGPVYTTDDESGSPQEYSTKQPTAPSNGLPD